MSTERRRQYASWCLCMFCRLLIAAGFVACIAILIIDATSRDAVYSVTITGVTGLDDPSTPALAPVVFNLTVSIDNTGNRLPDEACVERLSTVAVSYQDAPLGHGAVPQFCAKQMKVRERAVLAWSQDGVALPQFLRDQLADELAVGEALVEVTVTTPATGILVSDTVLVCSNVKVGGGPARCRTESVRQQQPQANPGSTN